MTDVDPSACPPCSCFIGQVFVGLNQQGVPGGLLWAVLLAFAVGYTCSSVLSVAHKRVLFQWGIAPLAVLVAFDYVARSALAPALYTAPLHAFTTLAPVAHAVSVTAASWTSPIAGALLHAVPAITSALWEAFWAVVPPLTSLVTSAISLFWFVTSTISTAVTSSALPAASGVFAFASILTHIAWWVTSTVFSVFSVVTCSYQSTTAVESVGSSFLSALIGQLAYYAAVVLVWFVVACVLFAKVCDTVEHFSEGIQDGLVELLLLIVPSGWMKQEGDLRSGEERVDPPGQQRSDHP